MQDLYKWILSTISNVVAFVIGGYIILLIIWVMLLWLASILGFQTPSEKRERQELREFVHVYRIAYCRPEQVPTHHCDKAFLDSDAENQAINDWVRYKISRDAESTKNKPWWYAIFGVFIGPFEPA